MQEQIKVLLIDNENSYRTRLANALKVCPYVSAVSEVNNSLETVDKALIVKPRIILTDITAPRSEWHQMISSLKENLPDTRLIVLTNSEKDEDVLDALSSGVDGYFLKGSSHTEIVQSLLKCAAGELVFSPVIANRLIAEFGKSIGTPRLSERETQVLKMLSEGMSNTEIAERLCVTDSTVRTYVYRILEKLNLNNRSEAVAYGARHYLTFTRIAEGFKAIRTQSEPGHAQIPATDSASIDQQSLASTLSATQSHAPEHALKETTEDSLFVKGERRQVTAVYASIKPFSRVPGNSALEETDEITDQCLELVLEEIRRHNGVVAWFSGSGVMAFFGVLESQEYSPQLALYAALAIRERLEGYIEQLNERGTWPDVRIGVNSGVVTIEKSTDGSVANYMPAGNTAELAISMCDIAEASAILVTQRTYRLTEGFFEFKPFGEANVKGEENPVEVYILLKPTLAETKFKVSKVRGLKKFVGRERELSLLRNCFDKVKEGRGQVVGILGEAGVGKSRLLLEFNNKLSDQTYIYLEGSCLFYGESTAYLPILRVLRSYFNIQEGEKAISINKKLRDGIAYLDKNLSYLLPPLQDLLSSSVDDKAYMELKSVEKRGKIFEAVRNLLIYLGQEKPLVLAIEDLHWIDNTSEGLLNFLIDGLASTKIMFMLIYRPEYAHRWNKKSYYTQLNLDELSAESAAELVRVILNEAEVSSELNDFISNKCGGNPLFLEEFIQYQLENGLIVKIDRKYLLASTKSDKLVPDTTQGIIIERLDKLDNKLKYVLQVASVIGNEFTPEILPIVSGVDKNLDSILQSLQGYELIHTRNLFPQTEYAFKHAVTREAVYNSLALKSRKEIHEKTGNAIEKLYNSNLHDLYEVLAHHYSKSDNLDKAYRYLRLSGDKAKDGYSNWEALRLYKEAINVLNRLPRTEENIIQNIETRYQISASMMSLGYPEDEHLQVLKEGERLCRDLGDERRLAEFCSLIGSYYTLKGRVIEGKKYIEKAYRSAELSLDLDLMVAIGFDLCRAYGMTGEHYKTVKLVSTVVQAVEQMQIGHVSPGSKTPRYYSYILTHYGYSTGCLGNFEQGQTLCEKGLRFAHLNNDKLEICYGECFYGWLLLHKGELANAIEHFQNAIVYCEELQLLAISGMSWTGKGWAYYLMGELEIALEYAEKAIQIQRDTGITFFSSTSYCLLSRIHLDLHHPKKARVYIEKSLKSARDNNEEGATGLSMIWLGKVLGTESDIEHAKAEKVMLQGIDILEQLKLKPWAYQGYLHLGKLYADTGQTAKALQALEKAEVAFEEMGMDYWLQRAQDVLAKVQS